MKEIAKNVVKIVADVQKFCIFAKPYSSLLLTKVAFESLKKVSLTKDNTPSMLTSVAHLGGFFFYKPLVL